MQLFLTETEGYLSSYYSRKVGSFMVHVYKKMAQSLAPLRSVTGLLLTSVSDVLAVRVVPQFGPQPEHRPENVLKIPPLLSNATCPGYFYR